MQAYSNVKGRQEDAQEFLGFLLHGLADELVDHLEGSEDDWQQVGKKKTVRESVVGQIFEGRLMHAVQCKGLPDSKSIEPFQSLPLDIEHVDSVLLAIQAYTNRIELEGYSQKGATRISRFDYFAPILVLHLKRFVFAQNQTQKLNKHVEFEPVMVLNSETGKQQHFELVAVVNHHGKKAAGGHYTCDIKQDDTWLRIDDEAISTVDIDAVVQDKKDRQPYLLFYQKQ